VEKKADVTDIGLPIDPGPVLGNVPGVEQFAGRRVFAQLLLGDGATVHQRLSNYRQTGVDGTRLVNVKHEVRVTDHVHPEPQRQTTHATCHQHCSVVQ